MHDLELTVPTDDAMDHLLEDDEGLVAGELHQQRVELVVELDDVPGLRGASHRGHVLVERHEVPGAAATDDDAEGGEVERPPGLVDIGDGRAAELEHEPRELRDGLAIGGVDARTAPMVEGTGHPRKHIASRKVDATHRNAA